MNNSYDFRILVIDDNPEIHRDFNKILTNPNQYAELDNLRKILLNDYKDPDELLPHFQIDAANQGMEGIKCIEEAIKNKQPYALAFVDVRMPPGLDGIETVKRIWKLDKDIQIVICTAYSDYTWAETIYQLGKTDNLLILKKPFDNTAVRQLACALTKKWDVMHKTRRYTLSLEKKLHYQASHDTLTDLPNRVYLHEKIKEAIAATPKNHYFALLCFDLDRFKLINDSISHATGDELLKMVAKRVQNIARTSDTLAHIGGDEFVLLVNNLPNTLVAANVADNLLKTIAEPFKVAEHIISLTSSIGMSIYPIDGNNAEELLRNAGAAMQHAKESGSNQYQFFTKKIHGDYRERLEKETEIRKALTDNQFFLCYQPQIDIKSEKIIAVEALIRWQHPTRGIILPIDFIPIAETVGLSVAIGEWVLRTACQQNKTWQDEGLPPIRMAINITNQQLKQFNFVETVKTILKETQLKPEFLELELSENTIISNTDTINTINALKQLGVHLALDDFGTGYSSLNYLRHIPLDRLKIDKSFVENIQINRGDEVLIHAIIAMANSLNLEVLAEGVETQKQLNFLKQQQCETIQGFYFSKPLSTEELKNLLKHAEKIKEMLG